MGILNPVSGSESSDDLSSCLSFALSAEVLDSLELLSGVGTERALEFGVLDLDAVALGREENVFIFARFELCEENEKETHSSSSSSPVIILEVLVRAPLRPSEARFAELRLWSQPEAGDEGASLSPSASFSPNVLILFSSLEL